VFLVRRHCRRHGRGVTPLQRFYLFFADAILVLHFAFVAFVVMGLVLIWAGWWRRWQWVRNVSFRVAHLAAIGVVAAESIFGMMCPLTRWEDRLRLLAGGEQRYAESFMQHWLHKVMFFDVPERIFTMAYVVFFILVALSFWLVPLQRRKRAL
jgi:hypothetical protein